MALTTYWQTGLPTTFSDMVNPLITQSGVFAGSFGHVVRLDSNTGKVVAHNPLEGRAWSTPTLAAPLLDTVIVVGIQSHVLGLDPDTLALLWDTPLPTPNSFKTDVALACSDDSIYATSNGWIHRLALDTGAVVVSKGISTPAVDNWHRSDEQLSLAVDMTNLLYTVNHMVHVIDPETLEVKWSTTVPDSDEIISVVAGSSGVGYVASKGRVHRLTMADGVLTHHQDLTVTGEKEVRMALDLPSSRLYIGTNGYGVSLKLPELEIIYSTSLPRSGYSITSVASGNDVAYFAINGIVYALNAQGQIIAKNGLSGRGYHETRLATSPVGVAEIPLLAVGINGYALGLTIPSSPIPLDYSGVTYQVSMLPYILDFAYWRNYDPSQIDGVGIVVGIHQGRIMGEELKRRWCGTLEPNTEGNSYTWVYTPTGALIYRWWDHDDRAAYVRHSQLGSGDPVICAGEMRVSELGGIISLVEMVNDASGHYKPDGGACLGHVQAKLEQLEIDTANIEWYFH